MVLSITVFLSFFSFLVFSFFNQKKRKRIITIKLLKYSAGVRIFAGIYWTLLDCPTLIFSTSWIKRQLQQFSLSFVIDYYFVIFGGVALFVTWSIIEFSHYYMERDPFKQAFFNTLVLFLFFMLLLVSSKSLFLLFVGWEGVGILSFILIGWWFTRRDANSSALQAIIYNRLGDRGMILFLILSITQLNTWNLKEVIFLKKLSPLSNWALIGIVIAATGKSAQFRLHPWLPSAMEGPTPVSALLHSSTMVVAGVFLLVRCSPLFLKKQWIFKVIAILGAITALFAARAALGQFDIKKIVAYSTTRQLGLMVVAVGLGLPWLALFHICTHAFFKALLFLCSGRIIHSLNNEQDLRKMGARGHVVPLTSRAITVARLALCGIPFLAGYYSKDLILEAAQYRIAKSLRIILSLIATLMTAAYSARIVFYLTLSVKSTGTNSPIREENFNLTFPLLRLLLGVFIAGWSFSLTTFHSFPLVVPLLKKSTPLIISLGAAFLIFFFRTSIYSLKKINIYFSNFFRRNWFYVHIFHGNAFLTSMRRRIAGVLRSLDQGWTAHLGPSGPPLFALFSSKLLQRGQTGRLTNYISYFTVLAIILFTTLYIFDW